LSSRFLSQGARYGSSHPARKEDPRWEAAGVQKEDAEAVNGIIGGDGLLVRTTETSMIRLRQLHIVRRLDRDL
jgi:hypothetical protein